MKLNLVEALLLIALDDEKGSFLPDSTRLAYSLGGAILLELFAQHRIEIENGRVKLLNTVALRDQLLQPFLDDIAKSTKNKKIGTWVERFGNKTGKLRRAMINRFVEQGVLEKREEKFLWIFTNNKYPSQNSSAENAVREHLREVVLHQSAAQARDALLLSLLEMCKLQKEVFGEAAQEDHIKERIQQITVKAEVSTEIKKAVKNIEDAIATALVISTVNTTMVV